MTAVKDSRPQPSSSFSSSRGYLAFPAGTSLTIEGKIKALDARSFPKESQTPGNDEDEDEDFQTEGVQTQNRDLENAWRERERLDEERRKAREMREKEEALKGEKDWVRMGGVLRDVNGKRDYVWTAEVKKLVEVEDAQRRAVERWAAYETALSKLSAGSGTLTFQDFPWPLLSKPEEAGELRDETAVARFLFEMQTLGVPDVKVSRRDRIRMSLLRWHPDKLGSVVGRVREEDVEAVKEGIDAVVISLMKLQDLEKADQSRS